MDAFLLKQVVAELSAALTGALVSRAHQPADRDVVLTLWTGREEKRLLLSADPEVCRLHLTTRKSSNPAAPPRFCQFLRRHMEGMRIESFALAPYDRSVRIDFFSARPDAEHARTSLYAELFGRHANLIYVDGDGTILCPLRTVSSDESRIREVAQGLPYRPLPRPARVFLPEVTPEDAARIHLAGGREGLSKALQGSVAGLGREVALETAARGKDAPDALYSALRDLVRRYEENDFTPGIGTQPDGKRRILPFPCPAAGFADFRPGPTANDAADLFYAGVSEAREMAALRLQLSSRIAAMLKKERHKLENIGGDEERLAEGLEGGAHGETLKANLGDLKKGMTSFRGIPLDPAKSPVENMNRFFRLARKAKGAVEIVRKRRREVTEGIYYIESLEAQLAAAGTRDELIAVRQEMSSSFPARPKPSAKKKAQKDVQRPVAPKVDTVSFRGFTILVGRNNVGNDRIVKDLCAPDDLWLHAHGIPGSHVLVKRPPGAEIPREVIEEGARLAVLHSKAKGSGNVPVFLAEARHVSKFKGAKPGLVRISKHTTVYVR